MNRHCSPSETVPSDSILAMSRNWSFSLRSLMLAVTCLAVSLGAFLASPGWGVACTVFVPAAIRTVQLFRREVAEENQKLGLGSAMFLLFESVIIVASILIACTMFTFGVTLAALAIAGAMGRVFLPPSDFAEVLIGGWMATVGVAAGIFSLTLCLRTYWSKRQF